MQCDRREVGLAWGEYCTVCRTERERRAGRVAQRVAIGGAVVLAGYLIWASPNDLLPRIFAAASVLLTYVILRRATSLVVLELMPRERKVDPVTKGDGPDEGGSP